MGARAVQSVLAPVGAQAEQIAWLWSVMLWTCATVFAAVVVVLAAALIRARRRAAQGAPTSERRLTIAVAAATGLTLVTLVGLLAASVVTGRALQGLDTRDAVAIRITGQQWWWDVEYMDAAPARRVRTANELHLPVGRPVALALESVDVIHSFWAPALAGKIDLIPGRSNVLSFRADRTGTFRAQCAEFCGLQHAHMAMDVVVETAAAFEAWLDRQRQPAPPPTDVQARRGRAIVERGPCAMCHAIAGTTAGARTAPDLSHVASRLTLGAGTLPNDRTSLDAWIENPQRAKPGNRMPPSDLTRDERAAVVAYLETLR